MIRQLSIIIALALALAACSKEPTAEPGGDQKDSRSLTFTYPGVIASRAVPATDREKAIHDLSIFAYAEDGTFVAELTEGDHYEQAAGGTTTTVEVSRDFLAAHAGERLQFYFIANNAASEGGSHTATINPATLTATEFENLPTAALPASPAEAGRQQGIFLLLDTDGLLMTAKSGLIPIMGKQTIDITPVRRTARFDLHNPDPQNYKLSTIYISSASDRGALFGTGKGTYTVNPVSVASFPGPWYSANPSFNDYDADNVARGYFYLYPGTFGQGKMELGVLVTRQSDGWKAMCYLDIATDTQIKANTRYTINFNPASLTFTVTENGNDWDDGGTIPLHFRKYI